MKIVIGIIIVLVGFSMVWKTESFIRVFGSSASVERLFGIFGGTRMLIKIIGIIAIFIAFLIMTGLITPALGWLLSPITSLGIN